MRKIHIAIIVALLLLPAGALFVSPRPPAPAAVKGSAGASAAKPPQDSALTASNPSGMDLILDRAVYQSGDTIRAVLRIPGRTASPGAATPAVVLTAPTSGDVEVLAMNASGDAAVYRCAGTLRLAVSEAAAAESQPGDGWLSALPGEVLHALWYVAGIEPVNPGDESVLHAAALASDPAAIARAPVRLLPELGLPGAADPNALMGKPSGVLLTEGGLPLRVATRELVLIPRDPEQTTRFLSDTGGELLRTLTIPDGMDRPMRTYHLIRVDPPPAGAEEVATLRDALGQSVPLYADSGDVLNLLAMTWSMRMQGYAVSVNPRLEPAAAPGPSPVEAGNIRRNMTYAPPLNVPGMWAFLAVWDADERRIPLAVLDAGFAPNRDYREPLVQCDLEGDSLLDGLLGGVECGPGVAVRPPTVGNSFFGDPSWHGNGVVATAGGVINNGWGAAGVGGQVVEPMLYRYGLASYAFEIGLGIRKAVEDGASVMNLSAGYPCRILTELDIGIGWCAPAERAAICAVATGGLEAALNTVCRAIPVLQGIPGIGPPLAQAAADRCGAARAELTVGTAACYSTLLLGDMRDPMEEAIAFAAEQGVPLVASAGNVLSRSDLPAIVAPLVDVENNSADDWRFVPATLPHVIGAGAAGDNWPFANIHFQGAGVDLWAPIRSTYFSPPTIAAVTGSDEQTRKTFGGTSAAAPYISGVIAAVQAVNPALDPRTPGLSAADRAAIVRRITDLLAGQAWSAAELNAMAPPAREAATQTAAAERRNLINPFRTVQTAAQGILPDLAALGFDLAYDTDESNPAAAADTQADATPISAGQSVAGAIVNIAGEDGAPDRIDQDWFQYEVPSMPLAFYRAHFLLAVPAGFGALTIDTPGYHIARSNALSTDLEDVYLIEGPSLLAGASDSFRIASINGSDNLYRLTYAESESAGPQILEPHVRVPADFQQWPPTRLRPSLDSSTSGLHESIQPAVAVDSFRLSVTWIDGHPTATWPHGSIPLLLESATDPIRGPWTPVIHPAGTAHPSINAVPMDTDSAIRLYRLRAP